MTSEPLTIFDRRVARAAAESKTFDMLVIGGGITGAGVLLDAASRGLSAVLVEREDFAAGTSSKSSKLVHGGLRYLQQREFRLVHENLVERQRLLHNAPHLVEPLPFLIPLFGKGGVVDQTVRRAYATALWMYDLAGGWRIGKRHRSVSAAEIASHMPTLRRDRLVAGFIYYDARTDDARLTLAIARTAVLSYGAVAINHVAVTGLLRDEAGTVNGAVVTDGISHDQFEIRARSVVNATGIWTDQIRAIDEGSNPHTIRPAKGIHLTVPAEKLPCDIAAVIPVSKDRRSIFVVPWGAHTYVGTTDTDYDGPLDDPVVEEGDVAYILEAINAAVTEPLSREDITGSWAGLRPLLGATPGHGEQPNSRTADLSRRHQVSTSASGVVTITGGKLTTYRQMAEDAVDAASKHLGGDVPRSRTKRIRLRGADGVVNPPLGSTAADEMSFLQSRYGSESRAVIALAQQDSTLSEPLSPGSRYLKAEAVFAVDYEMAMTIDDVLSRRTRLLISDAAGAATAAEFVASVLADRFAWSPEQVATAIDAFGALAKQ